MYSRFLKLATAVSYVICTAAVGKDMYAQANTNAFVAPSPSASMYYTPSAKSSVAVPKVSRVDLYGGYGYFHPVDSSIGKFEYQPINPGAVTSVAEYLNSYVGLQVEGTLFPSGPNDCVYTAQAGPIARYQHKRLVPFAHALIGGAKVGGPAFQPCTWGWGVTGGLGFDYILPGFGDHIALRPIQADYHYSQVNYGPLALPAGVSGGLGVIDAYTLSAGVVVRLGDMKPAPPLTVSCSVQPATVFAGDPVNATATVAGGNPKKLYVYTWSTTGGQISGKETANVTTTSLAAGDYSIRVHVAQGTKPADVADCNAALTVRAFEPPNISCSASPSSVLSGQSSTITSVAMSPQNRPLTYSYSSNFGSVSGTGNSVTLDTKSVSPGTIRVTCNAVDDLGKQASAFTDVLVSAPVVPPPPALQPQILCPLSFERDIKRPNRVDNESKACLDDIALLLQRDPRSKLIIVGNHAEGENAGNSVQRGMNVRQYFVDEKSIDPRRIEVRRGNAGTRSVQNVLLPVGIIYSKNGPAVAPESVHREGQPYGKPHPKR